MQTLNFKSKCAVRMSCGDRVLAVVSLFARLTLVLVSSPKTEQILLACTILTN